VSGAGSFGAMILVPAASLFLVLFDWKEAYWFLALLLLLLVLPGGFLLLKNRPQDIGLEPFGALNGGGGLGRGAAAESGPEPGLEKLLGRDATFREALRTPLFRRLTMAYFV
ncbi:MAG: hypothetical protein J4N69_02120, partial [Chloroflexi bacterium]|nr:hypothetical protein [Chloroflexota bacterium]